MRCRHTHCTAAPLTAPAASFPTDPSTGLHVESFTADRNFFDPSALVSTSRGSYYTGTDGLLVEHFRPIEPKAIKPITIEKAHGALLTELSSQDVTPLNTFDPVYARPIVDSASAEPEVGFDDLAFPSKLQSVTTFKRLRTTKQQVVLAQGQFFSGSPTDGLGDRDAASVHARERRRLQLDEQRLRAAGLLDARGAGDQGGQVAFAVGVTDRDGAGAGVVKRVLVAYKDAAAGNAWHFVDLAQSGTTPSSWSAVAPLTGTHLQYFVQAVDANGNVAVSTNKGLYYQETPPTTATGGVDVQTAGRAAERLVRHDRVRRRHRERRATGSRHGDALDRRRHAGDLRRPRPGDRRRAAYGDGRRPRPARTRPSSSSTATAPAITFGAPAANAAFDQSATERLELHLHRRRDRCAVMHRRVDLRHDQPRLPHVLGHGHRSARSH